MFAYCNNNPAIFSDSQGLRPVSTLECFDDIPIPAPPKEQKPAECNGSKNPFKKVYDHISSQKEVEDQIRQQQNELFQQSANAIQNAFSSGYAIQQTAYDIEARAMADFWKSDLAKDAVISANITGIVGGIGAAIASICTGGLSLSAVAIGYFGTATGDFVTTLLEELFIQ